MGAGRVPEVLLSASATEGAQGSAGRSPVGRGGLDRASDRRADRGWVAARLADPTSRAVVATAEGVLADGAAPALVPLREVEGGEEGEAALLGVDAEGAVFAVDPGPVAAARLRPEATLRGLRELLAAAAPGDASLCAYAVGLLNWRRANRHCPTCGAWTRPAEAGHARACGSCGAEHHPRTDPAVIVLVHDGDRALLGRERGWPEGMYSVLAGFVEPGETPEEAVVREVGEEAGVEVARVRYRFSQSWPFPTSLMLGFEAACPAGAPGAPGDELEDVRWVERRELERAAADEGPVSLPPELSIARWLIRGWLGRGGRA